MKTFPWVKIIAALGFLACTHAQVSPVVQGPAQVQVATTSTQMTEVSSTAPSMVEGFDDLSFVRAKESKDSSSFQKLIHNLGYSVPIYGTSFFQNKSRYASAEQMPVTDDYLVGPGDQLEVRVWGAINFVVPTEVDRNGQIFIPQVGSVNVTGVRFRDLRGHVAQAVGRMYRNFEVSVSMGKLRGIQVYVMGEANQPGSYTMSSLSTVVNAIMLSGGVTSQGSLRNIEVRRGGNTVQIFDLYELLLKGDKSKDINLKNGDVLQIPVAQRQIALTQGVVRPGIYEVKPNENLKQVIAWAGGLNPNSNPKALRIEVLDREKGLQVYMGSLDELSAKPLLGGEIVGMGQVLERFENSVTLRGQVLSPGRYPWQKGMRVKDLIPTAEALLTSAFFQHQNSADNKTANIRTADSLAGVNWEYAVIERFHKDSLRTQLIPFELDRAVLESDPKANLELQPGDVVTIFNTTDVSVPVGKRPVYVSLEGEIQRVGTYRVEAGQKLHDVIRQAGGLTNDAYVFGTKFLRPSAAELQLINYRKVVDEMERQFESSASDQLASASGPEATAAVQAQIKAQREWFKGLKEYKPDGRLVLEMDADIELSLDDIPNVTLEDGDRIIIPSRPSVVSVFGEVPMQNAFFFHKGNDVGDYLSRAGGTTRYADEEGLFVIRADGSVVSERDYGFWFLWTLQGANAMPGDAIFVPKDLEYSRWMADLKDWSQVLANFGLSAAAIVTLMNAVK